jgi:hypothetical protein
MGAARQDKDSRPFIFFEAAADHISSRYDTLFFFGGKSSALFSADDCPTESPLLESCRFSRTFYRSAQQ